MKASKSTIAAGIAGILMSASASADDINTVVQPQISVVAGQTTTSSTWTINDYVQATREVKEHSQLVVMDRSIEDILGQPAKL